MKHTSNLKSQIKTGFIYLLFLALIIPFSTISCDPQEIIIEEIDSESNDDNDDDDQSSERPPQGDVKFIRNSSNVIQRTYASWYEYYYGSWIPYGPVFSQYDCVQTDITITDVFQVRYYLKTACNGEVIGSEKTININVDGETITVYY